MNDCPHKPCYGKIVPETLGATPGRKAEGKVFAFTVLRPGGLGRPVRHIEINRPAWDECMGCPAFEGCYKLSMARVALESAVAAV